MPHICKVCDSQNTVADIKVDNRQRYKCLDCNVLFFDDYQPFKLERTAPAKIPTVTPKKYKCKKCDSFSTDDRWELTSHYSSAHSWHKREQLAKLEENMTNNMPTLTKNKPEPISRPIFESDDALITTLAADKKISWTDALHFLLSRTPEDNKNSDSQLMVEALDTLTEQINQLGVKVNSLTDTVENLNMLSVMDDGLKTDIIQALIMCKLWSDRETANKIKNAIEIIDGVEG